MMITVNELENGELFEVATRFAGKFFYKFQNMFLLYGMDINDLKQEAHLYLWKALEKYHEKPAHEIRKIALSRVYFRLRGLLFLANQYQGKFTKVDILHNTQKFNGEELTNEEFYDYISSQSKSENSLIWSQLKELCTERQYKLLQMRIQKQMSYTQIGLKLLKDKIITKQTVEIEYNKLRTKLKKYIIKHFIKGSIEKINPS